MRISPKDAESKLTITLDVVYAVSQANNSDFKLE